MNHKRKRPKHQRGGCLLCKPYKLTCVHKAERRKAKLFALSDQST